MRIISTHSLSESEALKYSICSKSSELMLVRRRFMTGTAAVLLSAVPALSPNLGLNPAEAQPRGLIRAGLIGGLNFLQEIIKVDVSIDVKFEVINPFEEFLSGYLKNTIKAQDGSIENEGFSELEIKPRTKLLVKTNPIGTAAAEADKIYEVHSDYEGNGRGIRNLLSERFTAVA